MTSTCPTRISFGSSMPFVAWSAATVTPKRWAMSASVSPPTTTYVRCGVGAAVGATVGGATLGVGAGVAAAAADGRGDGAVVRLGVGAAVAVGRADADAVDDGSTAVSRESAIPAATAEAPASALPPMTSTATRPRGERRARPAIPRHDGSGASTRRVERMPSAIGSSDRDGRFVRARWDRKRSQRS